MESIEKNVYVVQCSSGEYEERYTWIAGVFDLEEKAESLKKEIEEESKKIKDECPIKKDFLDMDSEEIEIYCKYLYLSRNEVLFRLNGVIIETIPFNKRIK